MEFSNFSKCSALFVTFFCSIDTEFTHLFENCEIYYKGNTFKTFTSPKLDFQFFSNHCCVSEDSSTKKMTFKLSNKDNIFSTKMELRNCKFIAWFCCYLSLSHWTLNSLWLHEKIELSIKVPNYPSNFFL